MERARTVKIEIKPAGYRRVRFIGIDIELPNGKRHTEHFQFTYL